MQPSLLEPWVVPTTRVQSEDGRHIVEVGWTVDRELNGDAQPHLFVYHWVDGQATCYNGCGFVQYSPLCVRAWR